MRIAAAAVPAYFLCMPGARTRRKGRKEFIMCPRKEVYLRESCAQGKGVECARCEGQRNVEARDLWGQWKGIPLTTAHCWKRLWAKGIRSCNSGDLFVHLVGLTKLGEACTQTLDLLVLLGDVIVGETIDSQSHDEVVHVGHWPSDIVLLHEMIMVGLGDTVELVLVCDHGSNVIASADLVVEDEDCLTGRAAALILLMGVVWESVDRLSHLGELLQNVVLHLSVVQGMRQGVDLSELRVLRIPLSACLQVFPMLTNGRWIVHEVEVESKDLASPSGKRASRRDW